MSSTTTIFYSQGFSFLNTVTSSSSGYQASIRAVKVDQLGNKYIAGNFDISATIKNTTITGNSKDIFSLSDVDGGLVGGASLTHESFIPIITSLEDQTE